MSSSLSVIASENAESIPLCQPVFFGDTNGIRADRIPHMIETIQNRLVRRLKELGMSVPAAERESGLAKDTLRKIIKNEGQSPNGRTLTLLSKGLGVSEQWLLHGDTTGNSFSFETKAAIPSPAFFQAAELPKDVPVHGTAAGSHNGGAFQLFGSAIDYVRRPPALMGTKDIYALYVEGTSMEPQFNPGDLIYVHPYRPARVGDPVVVQSAAGGETDIEATIGIYVRKTESAIIIAKHNPKAQLELQRGRVIGVHKIMSLAELFGV